MLGSYSPAGGHLRILVVDDDGFVRDILSDILSGQGHDVDSTGSGEAALTLIRASKDFDIIISDMNMPGMSGLELMQQTRRSIPDIPFIILTGNQEVRVAIDAMKNGANDYLLKDEDIEETVVISVDSVMETYRLKKENARLLEDLSAKNQQLTESKRQLELRNRLIRETFGRYLSDEVVTGLLEAPEGMRLGGEKRIVTIMMTDLRGFSALADGLDPQEVVALLNGYLEAMTRIIVKWHGTIDEFIGDAILAIFGAPFLAPDDHIRAAACALEMQREMPAVAAANREKGLPSVEMGIGIHTGEVVVGNIGSIQRAKYGVVGRAVNFASRIESYTVGGQILISEALQKALGSLAELGPKIDVYPKGMQAVTLHNLVGLGGDYGIRLENHVSRREAVRKDLSVTFVIVEGKDASGTERRASIVAVSDDLLEAEVTADEGVRPFTNVRFRFENAPETDVYAKVLGGEPKFGKFIIRFSSLPAAAREVIEAAAQ